VVLAAPGRGHARDEHGGHGEADAPTSV
jgi:hypothetical protein